MARIIFESNKCNNIELEERDITIDDNGTYAITPNVGYAGMSKVDINVGVDTLQGLNFSQIGYSKIQEGFFNKIFKDAFDFAKSEEELINKSNLENFLYSRYYINSNMIFFPNVDLSKFTSLTTTFNFSGLLYFDNLTTYNVTNFYGTFRYSPVIFIRCNTDNATTLEVCFQYALQVNYIELTNVENVTTFSNTFGNTLNLNTIKFAKWKQGNIIFPSNKITPESIHYIIQNAVNIADGAMARTLTLHTTAKTNWENSEYYQEDLAVLLTKGITIA